MSFLCLVDKSTSSSFASRISCRPLLPFLCPSLQRPNFIGAASRDRHRHRRAPSHQMDNFFVDALVKAGFCRHHSTDSHWYSTGNWRPYVRSTFGRSSPSVTTRHKSFHSRVSNSGQALVDQIDVSPEDYKSLVDFYDHPFNAYPPPLKEPKERSLYSHSVTPKANVQKNPMKHEPWATGTEAEKKTVRKLEALLLSRDTPHEPIYTVYRSLPHPRATFLSGQTIRFLLHRLSVVERKCEASMLRYLSVIDDMKAIGINLTSTEWSSAIAFVGRCFSKVSVTELQSALQIWKEMEDEAGVKGAAGTFNILFDVATKARKFAFAELILKEMQSRGLKLDRYTHVDLIYFHGLKGDGAGIRKAYKDLVDAGEIVDTVVLNCVIVSLVKVGEPQAAEQVYERMKIMHGKRTGAPLPPKDWRAARDLSRALRLAPRFAEKDPRRYEMIKKKSSVAPNLRTYRILVHYHSTRSGDLERLAELLCEMQFFDIPLHGCIFLALFKGFYIHGGIRYTSWTRSRLESVWSSYLSALDDGIDNLYMGKWLVIWILRAYEKCWGMKRTLQVWEEMQKRWKPKEGEMDAVKHVLANLRRPPKSSEIDLFPDDI